MNIKKMFLSLMIVGAVLPVICLPLPYPEVSGQVYFAHTGDAVTFPVKVEFVDSYCNVRYVTYTDWNGRYQIDSRNLPQGDYYTVYVTFYSGVTTFKGCSVNQVRHYGFHLYTDIALSTAPCLTCIPHTGPGGIILPD